jgi:hypothetical protein
MERVQKIKVDLVEEAAFVICVKDRRINLKV